MGVIENIAGYMKQPKEDNFHFQYIIAYDFKFVPSLQSITPSSYKDGHIRSKKLPSQGYFTCRMCKSGTAHHTRLQYPIGGGYADLLQPGQQKGLEHCEQTGRISGYSVHGRHGDRTATP